MTMRQQAWVIDWPRGFGDQPKVDAIFARLTDAGRAAFKAELEAAPEQDLAEIIETWFLSMRFATHPDREAADARAAEALRSEKPVTYSEFISDLRQAWADRDAASRA